MIGDEFQSKTKYTRGGMDGAPLDWCRKPGIYKEYEDVEKIGLPRKMDIPSMPVIESITKRHSVRSYSNESIKIRELSAMLWASTGIQRVEHDHAFRTSPSAGALYPIETYVVVNRVEGLENGIYHYSVRDHALETIRLGDFGVEFANACLGQGMCAKAQALLVWTGIFARSKWKYKQRAYRYVYLDAGHIAGNLSLAAIGIGMGTCQIGAFFDEEVNDLLGIDGIEESVVYASTLGYPI